MKRELVEEFGVQVEVAEFLTSNNHHHGHISIELLAFYVKYISGEFTLTDHDIIEWVAPEELHNYDLGEADIPIARAVVNHARHNSGD